MMILDEIAEKTRERVAGQKERVSLEQMKAKALAMDAATGFPFERAMEGKELSFICEVKKASPSKGVIAEDFPYLNIAREYEEAGASAISVLTEPCYFQGENRFLEEISREVSIPLLRKDFTVDSYMIYEAKVLGASAVLLICAILTDEQLKDYLNLAHSLGLSALVEAHTGQEVERAVAAGARIVGVNNRDLKTFQVDVETSLRLRAQVPSSVIYISESGIRTPEDIRNLREYQVNGVLIGESFMRSPDKKKELARLKGE